MGGEITVESEYGRGTIFTVTLPLIASMGSTDALSSAGSDNRKKTA
jgi:chemotaxis protein histidine kinase CheA